MKREGIFAAVLALLAAGGSAGAACVPQGAADAGASASATCVEIGGSVQTGIDFGKAMNDALSAATAGKDGAHFKTQADVTVTTKSMTDLGPLTTFIDIRQR